ncbi:MAG: class I SAM-dependent methyltransferase [Burkholderiales bacterium]|nr:MAG: class I SAM-dependent methyltransferase [Burkholderiales bacterium]
MSILDSIDITTADFVDLFDELPLWSAPFGLWMLDRVPLRPGQAILDVGAGTGFLSIELAERCGRAATVHAVDPWGAATDRLRRKIAQRGLSNLVVLSQDAAVLPLPERSIDVIVSNLGVNNFDQPDTVLAECARVARPGSCLLLTTNLVGHMAEFYDVYRQVLSSRGQAGSVARLDEHIAHRATPDSVSQLLARTGFAVEEVTTGSFRLRFADGSALLNHFFIRMAFVPAWAALVEPGTAPAVFDALEAALNDRAASRGELALTIPTAGFVARRVSCPAGQPAPCR